MDEEGTHCAQTMSNLGSCSMNTIMLNLSSSGSSLHDKKKQLNKMSVYRDRSKNGHYRDIQVIFSTGKNGFFSGNKLRCKVLHIYPKPQMTVNANLLKDYVIRFYEKTFEKMFLTESHQISSTINNSGGSCESTHKQQQQQSNQSHNSSKQNTDEAKRAQQQNQIEFQTPKIATSYLCQNLNMKCPQIKVETVEQPSLPLIPCDQCSLQTSDPNFQKSPSDLNHHFTLLNTNLYNSQKSEEKISKSLSTRQEEVVENLFHHLESTKQRFNSLFNNIGLDNQKVNHKSSSQSISTLNYNQVNSPQFPYSTSSSNFETCLPHVKLKSGQEQKFKEEINKIFKNFLHRGKEGRARGNSSHSNSVPATAQASSSYVRSEKQRSSSSSEKKKKPKRSFDSKQQEQNEEEDEEDIQYFGEEDEEVDIDEEDDIAEEEEESFEQAKEDQAQFNLSMRHLTGRQAQGQKKQQIQKQDEIISYNQSCSINELNQSQVTLNSLVFSRKKIVDSNAQVSLTQNTVQTEPIISIPSSIPKSLSTESQLLNQPPLRRLSSSQQPQQQSARRKISSSSQSQSISQQSKYHNLKNSFMHLIIYLFHQEVLYCFDIPHIYLDYSISIIERMKNHSFKYRPVKGRYQYYSNIHYSTLFLYLNANSLKEVKSCPQNLQYHEIFFNENLSDCSKSSDFSVIKCNFYKLLIGQIVAFTLDNAEAILQNIDESENYKKYLNSSRYNYISKVKKGILKLQKGKHVIRF